MFVTCSKKRFISALFVVVGKGVGEESVEASNFGRGAVGNHRSLVQPDSSRAELFDGFGSVADEEHRAGSIKEFVHGVFRALVKCGVARCKGFVDHQNLRLCGYRNREAQTGGHSR